MTSHLLDPLIALVRAIRPAPPKPDPIAAMLDGLQIPEELIGRHFDVTDSAGNVVATTRRQADARTMAMIG